MTASLTVHRFLLASAAMAVALPEFAQAQQQDVDPNTTVTNRARPAYDPLGIRAGSFLVFPEVGVTGSYSDNVGLDEEDEESDFVTNIEPTIEFQSQWSTHSLSLEVGSDIAIHAEESDEDYEDFFAAVEGQLDVSRQTTIQTTADARLGHVGRDDEDDEDSDDELQDFYQFGGGIALNHQINRLGFSIGGDVQRSVFDDDDDRDVDEYNFRLRPSYEVSPRLGTFVEGRYNVQDSVNDNDDDSDGYELSVGANLDISAVLFGEAAIGYRAQEFDDGSEESGPSFAANLSWNPSLLTSVQLAGRRDFVPAQDEDADSNFETVAELTIAHELLRNVIVEGTAAYENSDFIGDDREDNTIGLGAGLTYWLNRNLSFNAGYDFSERDSNEAGEDFTVNRFSIGLTIRL